jgi:putative heme-binding domain-containing protein
VNIEEVAPQRSSFIGKHTGDVLVSKDQWFRGVNLVCGPDGGVLVADWCDDGECHDDDGVHRSSGRIYKIVYEGGDSQSASPRPGRRIDGSFDLAERSDEELAAFITDENEWFARRARRLLQERLLKPAGALAAPAIARVRTLAGEGPRIVHRLRALWTLHACELPMSDELTAASASGDEDVRAWAVRLMVDDRSLTDSEEARLIDMARTDASPRVRLHLASALHRVPANFRWRLANTLLVRGDDVDDNVLQLVLWRGIEPLVAGQADESADALRSCVFPKLRRFIARRLAAEFDRPEVRGVLAALLAEAAAPGSVFAEDVLSGVRDGLRGRVGLAAPANWPDVAASLLGHPSDVVREAALDLSIVFRDGATIDRLRQSVRDGTAPEAQRREALGGLIRARPDDLGPLLDGAFGDPVLRLTALRGFRTSAGDGTARRIVDAYAGLTPEEKQSAIDTLVSRAPFARGLLDAVSSGKVSRSDVTATHAKLLLALDDSVVKKRLAEVWGTIATSDVARRAQIDEWKEKLSQTVKIGPDTAHGKAVFARVCAACHVLFGEGGRLGPDLTGSARKDLDYLVRNIVDPSATVPRDYQMTIVRLKDGQVLSGVVPREDENTLTLQSIVETRVLDRTLISRVDRQLYSWMPEGLLSGLEEREVRDLVAYLQSDSPVGAAAASGR